MKPDATLIIVTEGPTAGTSRVHHRDFPEVRADGESPAVAATHLVNQLTRSLDTALTTWRRESIQKAIADVQAFAESKG